MGKLIVIDGLDASGKETQSNLLYQTLKQQCRVRKIQFPNYEDASSALIKMYLAGQFGAQPSDVNAYAASTFYAVDRYASFKKDWKNAYDAGEIIISDRYTTSNAIHQASKLSGKEREEYLDWLYDFEYRLLELPKPDLVLFLHMPVSVIISLMRKRYQNDETKRDIHEKNEGYLEQCYESAMFSASHYGWQIIDCVKDGKLRAIEEIQQEIYNKVKEFLI